MKTKRIFKKILQPIVLAAALLFCTQPVLAADVPYLPDVTEEMTDYRFWANLYDDADELLLTMEEIKAFNQDTIDASGTNVMDLRAYPAVFDGIAKNEAIKRSSTADAEYYFGWTYEPDGSKAEWDYYQTMIDNCWDPAATEEMPFRYGIAVNRSVLKVFPSDDPIWDDPADIDFDYQSLSAVRVNEPVLIYTTSADGKYFLARTDDCSGWLAAEDVALCADKEEWLAAWDLPSEDLLVVYGNKIYTEASIYAPETSRRLLTQGTALELVKDIEPDQVIINRYPYHNYVVYLPVRLEDGSYAKQMAFISETAEVSIGYLPLTKANLAMVALENLGDTYGWGGMLDVEDCSGQIRTIYACFGMEIGRNGNWQWKMNMEKIDMSYMSIEEKCLMLDELPIGTALCFPGHEMFYLGKYEGKYYVISTVGSIMSPDSGKRLRVRGVILNTLDIKRANGQTWLQAIDKAFVPAYPLLEGKSYDFPEVQWYHSGVYYCLKNGLLSNNSDGLFGINETVTRGALMNALWRLEGKPAANGTVLFEDVPAESEYYNAVCWAAENGLVSGYDNGLFAGDEPVTRSQLAVFLLRYAQFKGADIADDLETNILSYKDVFDVPEYAIPAMQWACGSGVLVGNTDANGMGMLLDPNGITDKAQLAVILMRYAVILP